MTRPPAPQPRHRPLPDLVRMLTSDRRLWIGFAIYWLVLATLFGTSHYVGSRVVPPVAPLPLRVVAVLGVADSAAAALVAVGALALASAFPLDPGIWRRNIAVAAVMAPLGALAHGWITHTVRAALGVGPAVPFGRVAPVMLASALVVITGFLAAGYAFHFSIRSREAALTASRLEGELARAELSVLKMQLHPHFLFNSFNAIAALMHRDVDAADRMLTGLGEMLRHTLRTSRTQEVRLREELDFIRLYLDIQQVRFGDRLTVRFHADEGAGEAFVPHLILQPVVENALLHGIARTVGPGALELAARREGGALRLEVRDTGPGLPEGWEPRAGAFGLENTRARLAQMYGDAGRLEMRNADGGGALVSLTMPFRTTAADAAPPPSLVRGATA
jgi:two-component system LytT family sensor kinase